MSVLGEIHFHLQVMLNLGFETMRRYGRLSECEFFVDVDGARFADYMFIDTSLRSADPQYAPQGTMYLGSRFGKRSMTVYDKSKHLAEKMGEVLPQARLRIEGKVRGGVHLLKDIGAIPNPFSTLCVIDKQALADAISPPALRMSDIIGWGMSPQMAYCMLTPKEKKDLRPILVSLQPSWWQPSDAWSWARDSLEWMETLSMAGITGEYLPLGSAAFEKQVLAICT